MTHRHLSARGTRLSTAVTATPGGHPARRLMARLHGRTAAGVPRWAVWAAYATTLTVLPSCVWRIAAISFHAPLLERSTEPAPGHGPVVFGGVWYVVALSVVSEALAYLAFGLVGEWGERIPHRIPVLGGRRVPILAAVIPAGLGAVALLIFPYALVMAGLGRMIDGAHRSGLVVHGWQSVAFVVAYGPLAAWGPLLGLLTVHYYRRRRNRAAHPGVDVVKRAQTTLPPSAPG
ncbi:hypothetical protein [Actinoallomurus soli]|uniref:hypothetical protein n=1 Tax=Actinoallomurus soli TaxID=2952535 RepID=UPI002091F1E2|nr:hypothetical protein [Actinoallomurus soli]MCO5970895.1 hypothetical protein [Actinoallomurus soli]